MRKYSTLLMDVDNTLLDFTEDERVAVIKTLKECGLPHDDITVKTYSKINDDLWHDFEKGIVTKEELKILRFKRLIERFSLKSEKLPSEINELYAFNLGEGGILFEGALEVCLKLVSDGYKIYGVTNGLETTQKKRLRNSGLDKIFKEVFVSEKIGFQKPTKEYFNYVFSHIEEKDKKKILLVGDSLSSDIKGAVDSGIDCLWINPQKKKADKNCIPTYEADFIGEIEKFL